MVLRAFPAVRVGELMLSFRGAVGIDAFGNRVAVDPERFGGIGNSFLVPNKSFLNVEFFKLVERFIQKDVAVKHVFDYCF